jgi:hypothetical protein
VPKIGVLHCFFAKAYSSKKGLALLQQMEKDTGKKTQAL